MNQDAEVPDSPMESNYFAEIHTIDRDAVAAAFECDGHWSLRNAGFEAQSNYGELIIESENPVLVHGSLHSSAVDGVNTILSSIGSRWKSEIYDPEGNIFRSFDDSAP